MAAKAAGFGNGKTYEQAKSACEECEWKCDGDFQAAHASMRIAGRFHGRCKAFQVAHAPVKQLPPHRPRPGRPLRLKKPSRDIAAKFDARPFQKKPLGWFVRERDFPAQADIVNSVFSQGLLAPKSGPKPTHEQVQRLAQKFAAVSKNVVPITVVRSPSDVPSLKVPTGVSPTGALSGGQIYLFSDNLRSVGDVSVTIFHELFHLGLEKVVAAEDYAALLREFVKGSAAQQFVNQWKNSPEGQQRVASMPSAAYEALAAEEGLALVSEALFANDGMGTARPDLIRDMLSWLAKTADRLGFDGKLTEWIRGLSRTDAETFVAQMVRAAMGGPKNLERTQQKFATKIENLTAQTRLSQGLSGSTLAANADGANIVFATTASPPAPAPGQAIALEKAKEIANQVLDSLGLRDVVNIRVVRKPSDVGIFPPAGVVPTGGTSNGQIYLFTDSLAQDSDAFRVVFHELFHLGLSKTLDQGEYVQRLLIDAGGQVCRQPERG